MSKYIIRNCPSCRYTPKRYIDGIDYICWNAQNFNSSVRGVCQDYTDCVLKQIVKRCREAQKEYPRHFTDGETDMFVSGRNNLAGNILALLDMEEVE